MEMFFGNKKFYGRYTLKEYYGQFHIFNTLKDLLRLLDQEVEPQVVSSLAIKFNVVGFGDSVRDIKKKLGKPLDRKDNSDNVPGHEKLYYKLNFGAFTAISQMHFLNDVFFMGQYFFNQIGQAKLALTKDLLIQKYTGLTGGNLDNFIIADASQNKIKVFNDSFGIVHYISGDPAIRERLIKELNYRHNKSLAIEQMKRQELISLL
jgi:hypothetical protein